MESARQDIQHDERLPMQEKIEFRRHLVDKYKFYTRYELVQDKTAAHKKIILKAISTRK